MKKLDNHIGAQVKDMCDGFGIPKPGERYYMPLRYSCEKCDHPKIVELSLFNQVNNLVSVYNYNVENYDMTADNLKSAIEACVAKRGFLKKKDSMVECL
jgi:hypothetical protein